MEKKMNVGIMFGGRSGEHEVSLSSSYNVINAIDRNKFDLTLIGITREGRWSIYTGDVEKIKEDTWEQDPNNRWDFSLFSDNDFNACDIFFPVMHGTFSEDGTLQGLFEMLDKPYVGCGVLASSAAMDKCVFKVIMQSEHIPVAKGLTLYKSAILKDIEAQCDEAEKEFDYPIFVKPANMGSSVGISKAHDRDELKEALMEAIKYDTKLLLEEFIDGREIEIAALGNEDVQISYPGWIKPCHEFYDYEAKYLSGDDSEVVIPAPIPEEKVKEIQEYAKKAYIAIGGSGLSRIDFFLTNSDNRVILNEINTMPGFTNISMYPKLWDYCGVNYPDLIEKLIGLGLDRYKVRKELLFKKQ
ncbi:MAG: D-alanine--D-alanine ligase [Eubacteriaceae bacterium]|nr:D-alanine--D-alanine ligase [Eubacteriaceae bacterium]